MNDIPTPELTDDVFAQWLTTGTLRRREVTLIADLAAADEIEEIYAEMAEYESGRKTAERTLGEKDPLRAFEERFDAAMERFNASRSTWMVVRLDETQRIQLQEMFAAPERPRMLGTGASQKKKDDWQATMDEWRQKCADLAFELARATIAYSIEWVEIGGKRRERILSVDGRVETPAVTTEQLAAAFAMPYGSHWQAALSSAVNEVASLREEPSVPLSRDGSGSDQN